MCPFRVLRAPSFGSGVRGYITFRTTDRPKTRGLQVVMDAHKGLI